MLNRKKRILLVSEASFLLSGYGKYAREILLRLHKTDKYELAEFASYGKISDPRSSQTPWKFYPNQPSDNQTELVKQYKSQPDSQFGRWRLDRVLLDFKPDIVWAFRDFWMDKANEETPYRDFFHYCIMPTVDSIHQQEDWIEQYIKADSVFTYSNFSLDLLNNESNNRIKTIGTASPGADIDIYKPVPNKEEHKQKMGLSSDMFIIGTVMRNQRRKLFPDMLESFNLFLDTCHQNDRYDLANKAYLYFHTSIIDVGWNIPELLKQEGLCNKVLFSYICKKCGQYFPAFFNDCRTYCPACKEFTATSPNVGMGISESALSDIYNLFDVYVQYSICEGFGLPIPEAASCGVPVMAVDYSAMSDNTRKVNGILLKVNHVFRELESHSKRVYPSNEYFANELYKFIQLPQSVRWGKGKSARRGVLKHYTWDKTAKIWEDHFDSIELTKLQGLWNDVPSRISEPNMNVPQGLDNSQFVDWCIGNILVEPIAKYQYLRLNLIRFLNYGCIFIMGGHQLQKFGRDNVMTLMSAIRKNKNSAEHLRLNQQLDIPDYIEFANQ